MTKTKLKLIIRLVAVLVFLICFYTFLLGNGVFKGDFENDAISWYFLAKGLFCSASLFLSLDILEAIRQLKDKC